MGTRPSELGPFADRFSPQPRIYADANIPAGLVAFMRSRLKWDVLFVIEHDDLRRAHDIEHFRLARRLHRTLITFDRDYLDDRRFPLEQCAGVLVVSGRDEASVIRLLSRLDRAYFRPRDRSRRSRRRRRSAAAGGDAAAVPPPSVTPLPLQGRKLLVHPDWQAT